MSKSFNKPNKFRKFDDYTFDDEDYQNNKKRRLENYEKRKKRREERALKTKNIDIFFEEE
jgi:hypothetical protein